MVAYTWMTSFVNTLSLIGFFKGQNSRFERKKFFGTPFYIYDFSWMALQGSTEKNEVQQCDVENRW